MPGPGCFRVEVCSATQAAAPKFAKFSTARLPGPGFLGHDPTPSPGPRVSQTPAPAPPRASPEEPRHPAPPRAAAERAPRLVDKYQGPGGAFPARSTRAPPAAADLPARLRAAAPNLRHTCCRGRLPPHTTPGCAGGGGGSRGSHMRPPGAPSPRSRRRGPPRSARIRDAGPVAGADAAPPLRLRLPGGGSFPSLSRAVCVLRPGTSSSPPETPSASSGPVTESKMAPGARGRALAPARLRPRGRARGRAGFAGARTEAAPASGTVPGEVCLGAECGRVGVNWTRLAFPRVKTGKFRAVRPTQKAGECLQGRAHPYRT